VEDVVVFNGPLKYYMANWYILCPFGILYGHLVFLPILVCCAKKNLATLSSSLLGGRRRLYTALKT
jgi:hypothetical protein